MTLSEEDKPKCTTKCPAIRYDKGTWYCHIMRACVAPSEHHFDYGFDIVKEGKITHSGYSTPCDAIKLFHFHPVPSSQSIPAAPEVPEPSVCIRCPDNNFWKARYDKSREAAICNATLDAIIKFIDENNVVVPDEENEDSDDMVFTGEIRAKIESLRIPT